jgi:hypothetical protein
MPFAGGEAEDVLRATLFGSPKPLSERVSKLPPELDSLVLHLLDRDPGRRPSNAAAVAAELERMAAAGGLEWKLAETDAAVEPEGLWDDGSSIAWDARWVSTRGVR